jgi:hypothetical protein
VSQRVVACKVRLELAEGCRESPSEATSRLLAVLGQDAVLRRIVIEEPRECVAPRAGWESLRGLLGADRVPAETAEIFRLAIARARKIADKALEPWVAIELALADFLAGAPR